MEPTSRNWLEIPEWDKKSPIESFAVLSNQSSGRIPVTRLETWRDFPSLLDAEFLNQPKIELVFRGHQKFDWTLVPTLDRRWNNAGISNSDLADRQLALFKKAIRGRVKDHSLLANEKSEDNEIWSIGQHHGLLTPLLDWTYSPYIALFFAFCEHIECSKNQYRAVYMLNKSFIEKNVSATKVQIIEPRKDDYGRAVCQAGVFTLCSPHWNIESELASILAEQGLQDHELPKYICKVYIKNQNQPECLKYLSKMNIHYGSLFPDIFGASKYCNQLILDQENA